MLTVPELSHSGISRPPTRSKVNTRSKDASLVIPILNSSSSWLSKNDIVFGQMRKMPCSYYAVREGGGRTWGIFTSWPECHASTNGFKRCGNQFKVRYGDTIPFKGFNRLPEALAFLGADPTANPQDYYASGGRHSISASYL